jgi:hypothetical protein
MRKCTKPRPARNFVPATIPGVRPGDFPVGSLQSRAAARAMLAGGAEEQCEIEPDELGDRTPIYEALIEDVDNRSVRIYTARFLRAARIREKAYETVLPWRTPEEIRHNRAVFKEIDRLTGGEAASLRNGDSAKWNRLKAIAEGNLRIKAK